MANGQLSLFADGRQHVCNHCGKRFGGRKRKYCGNACMIAARDERARATAARNSIFGRFQRKRPRIIDWSVAGQAVAGWQCVNEIMPAGCHWCSSCQQFMGEGEFISKSGTRKMCRWCAHLDRVKYGGTELGRHKRRVSEHDRARRDRRAAFKRYVAKERRAQPRETPAQWFRRRYRADPEFRVRALMRSRMNKVLREGKNMRSYADLVGYDVSELVAHIEAQFTSGMSWSKFMSGEIHIDHIVPLSKIKGADDERSPGFRFAWSLRNLRPLWARHNWAKGDRITKASMSLIKGAECLIKTNT